MGECPFLFHSEKVGGWIKGGGTLLSKVPLAKEGHQLPAQNNITEIQDTTMIEHRKSERVNGTYAAQLNLLREAIKVKRLGML